MCPCGEFGIGLDLSMLVRPEIRPLFWTVVFMVWAYLIFLGARGKQQHPAKKHREPGVGDIVQQIAEDNARLRKEIERQKPRWRF
jgi:hypothetical protein